MTINTIDRAQEYRRLEELYASMIDDGLHAITEDARDLTHVALQAVQAEISRRGIDFKIQDTSKLASSDEDRTEDFDASDLDLVVAQRVSDIGEARQAKEVLNATGIPSYLGPNNVENPDEIKTGFEGGTDLKVRDVDSQRAARALSQVAPSPEQVEKEYVARCPKCHSSAIIFQGLDENSGKARATVTNWRKTCALFSRSDAGGHGHRGQAQAARSA